ncbi:aldo/keto reductase [Phenylobacterium sp.]|jgi:L-galactose dehydrogenase|uniref:aldo/keto reductase n=1 Tax=Phenylobacterium sp. TaxID=1871053 RepID=UPI002E337530|nr:aldo/keto reductase [Phenylobacterium sp.]HEX2560540.1 aldo/keto reductase [Phenylobacterium sp.]
MQTVRLGRTGVEVSVAGLGCGGHSRLGMARGASAADAAGIVRLALDLGITFIDTARAYGTEEAVGLGVQGRRDQVFISTKAAPTRGGVGRDELISPEELTESLELSLRRLQTDRVDLFNLHGVQPAHYQHCAEVLVPELKRQQAAGKIRYLGLTEQFGRDTRHETLARAVPDGLFDVVMVGFNLLNPSARRRVFPLTMQHDVGTLIMFAVRRALSDPAALREVATKLVESGEVDRGALNPDDPLDFLASHPDVESVVQAAYRFCRHEPGTNVILTGTGSGEHLRQNVRSILDPPLPAELCSRLEAVFGRVESVSGN